MSTLRLPNFWRGMSWHAKAAHLLATNQARFFSEACSMLAKMRRPKRVFTQPVVARLPYKDSED